MTVETCMGILKPVLLAGVLLLLCGGASAVPERLFPAGPPPAKVLDVVDMQLASLDQKLAATTLQGLVNREEEAKVYLGLAPGFWLEELKRKGYIEGTRDLTLDAFFDTYLDRAAGLVVYDPDLPVTMNTATMIAAVENRVAVGPEEAARFQERLPDVTDLRGRWKTNVEAGEWAFENLWPKMRHDILAVYHPVHAHHHLRDYLVAQKVFTLFVSGTEHDGRPECDHAAEEALARRVLAAAEVNIPVIGWWDGGELDTGMTEYGGVGMAGEYGKLMVGNNWQDNLSLLAGVPVDLDALMTRFRVRKEGGGPAAPEADKVYLCYAIMESGDSPTYWQHVQKAVWDDPARGTFPIGWTITPTLLETLPTVAEWYLDHATEKDHFLISLSGWGYCHPYRNFMARTPEPDAAWNAYLWSTASWMRYLGIDGLGLYTDAWRPFRRAEKEGVTRRFTEGIPGLRTLVLGMGRDEEITETEPHYLLGNAVVSHIFTRWDAANVGRSEKNNAWLAEEIRKNTPATRPAFMFVHPLSWAYHPSDLAAVTEQLGEEYVVVSPATLSSYIRESLTQ